MSDEVKLDIISQFLLQSVSRKILCKSFYKFSQEKVPGIFSCCRCHIQNEKTTKIIKNSSKESCFYANLQKCKSVWVCPVCSAQITNVRLNHLENAEKSWKDRNVCHGVGLLTLTIPHYRAESLRTVKARFQKARLLFRNQKKLKKNPYHMCYSEIAEQFGIVGGITSHEVTYGSNGWHVHSHEMLFFSRKLTDTEVTSLTTWLILAWQYAAKRAGVSITGTYDFGENALDFKMEEPGKNGGGISEYLVKISNSWSLSKELVLSNIKKGSSGSRTPWDFLRYVFWGFDIEENKKLFKEYVRNFAGSRQLFFSQHMKSILDYDETDEEIELEPEAEKEFMELSAIQWDIVLKFNKRSEVLQVAKEKDYTAVIDYIENGFKESCSEK